MTCAECKDFTYEVGSGRFPTCRCFVKIPTPADAEATNARAFQKLCFECRGDIVRSLDEGRTRVRIRAFMGAETAERVVATLAPEFEAAGWKLTQYHCEAFLLEPK
jgi:hypothetical protein